jgi:predicted ester cyclase
LRLRDRRHRAALEGARRCPAFYRDLFAAFPDNAFALSEIVVGPQGVFEVATLTGTNQGPWAGVPASGLAVALEVLILFPWDPVAERFGGERIWFDRGGPEH